MEFCALAFDSFVAEITRPKGPKAARSAIKLCLGSHLKSSRSFHGSNVDLSWVSLFEKIDSDWGNLVPSHYLGAGGESEVHELLKSWAPSQEGDSFLAYLSFYWFHVASHFPQVAETVDRKIFDGKTFEQSVGLPAPFNQEHVNNISDLRRLSDTQNEGEQASAAFGTTATTNIELSGKLSEKAWLNFRIGRRSVHPTQVGTRKPLPLIESSVLSPVTKNINEKTIIQYLISGQIATGKSSMVEIIIQAWRSNNPTGIVTVMPMGGDYSSGGGWITKDALSIFLKDAACASRDINKPHLLVIEDCHEFYIHNRSRYNFEGNVDLSNVSVIATTRPPYDENILSDIEEWSGLRLCSIKTDAKETATRIIQSCVEGKKRQAQFDRVFIELGGNLVALAAALLNEGEDGSKIVQKSLAYSAILEELEQVFDPESDHVQVLTRDIGMLKTGLLAVWMLGAVECDFNAQDLCRLLNISDASAIIRSYESSKQIFPIGNRRFRCSQHPAWGQLTMRAVSEHDPLSHLSKWLGNWILESAKVENEKISQNYLVTFLFGIIYQKILDPVDLGRMATSRRIYDEFVLAAEFYVEHGQNRSGPTEDTDDLLVEISSSKRRLNFENIELRQNQIEQADKDLKMTIRNALRTTGKKDLEELSGTVLYEAAYHYSRKGNLQEATLLFSISKEKDISKPGRERFGVMSGVRESIMLTYQGKIDAASSCLNEIEPVLIDLLSNEEDAILMRFKSNFIHAQMEIAFAHKNASKANFLIDKFMEASISTNSVKDRSMYDARVCLILEKFAIAKDITDNAVLLTNYTEHGEKLLTMTRIHGDSLLGLGRIEEAREEYRKITTGPENPLRFRDHEIQLVDDRLKKIALGIDPIEILRGARI